MPPFLANVYLLLYTLTVTLVLYWLSKARRWPKRQVAIGLGPTRHESLPEPLIERVRQLQPIFAEVYPRSNEQWLDGFKRDINPEPEIAIWEAMGAAYTRFNQNRTLDLNAKGEVLGLLILRSSADEESILAEAKLKYLSPAEAQELLRLYSVAPKPLKIQKGTPS